MVSHPADTLVSLGGQRVARAAAEDTICSQRAERHRGRFAELMKGRKLSDRPYKLVGPIPASEAEAWKDLVEALADYGPRHPAKPKPLSDRMNVGE